MLSSSGHIKAAIQFNANLRRKEKQMIMAQGAKISSIRVKQRFGICAFAYERQSLVERKLASTQTPFLIFFSFP